MYSKYYYNLINEVLNNFKETHLCKLIKEHGSQEILEDFEYWLTNILFEILIKIEQKTLTHTNEAITIVEQKLREYKNDPDKARSFLISARMLGTGMRDYEYELDLFTQELQKTPVFHLLKDNRTFNKLEQEIDAEVFLSSWMQMSLIELMHKVIQKNEENCQMYLTKMKKDFLS